MYQSTFAPDPKYVQDLLKICPAYHPTPIVRIDDFAPGGVLLKDESDRMGLGSFKALGGVYAVYRLIAEGWARDQGQPLDPAQTDISVIRDFARDKDLVFVCASAGNHGLSVAAGAQLFGAQARIHLAETVSPDFAKLLQTKGAEVVRSGQVYEDSTAAAMQDANTTGALLLADGSWPGYVSIPSLVMEGYTVLAEEMRRAFEANSQWPTHVALQAGVGGLAAAIAHMVRRNWTVQPEIFIVEPEYADCLGTSHRAGRLARAEGPVSNMGRLDCKEASLVAFEALQQADVQYVTISDDSAQSAADTLRKHGINTSPSGAAGLAFIRQLDLPDRTRALAIISEGAAA